LNVTIHANNVVLPDSLRKYAEEKIKKLDRHFDRILEARMEIEAAAKRGPEPLKQLSLRVHVNGSLLEGKVQSRELQAGVDEVIDKLDAQLRRRKERVQDHKGDLPTSGIKKNWQ
jgi:putative sigma-54 modulation protein